MAAALADIAAGLAAATERLLWMALAFGALALLVRGRAAVAAARRSAPETRLNLVYYLTDAALVVPAMLVAVGAVRAVFEAAGPVAVPVTAWDALPDWAVLLAAVAVSDFAGYWRHRLMHTGALWPAHAIHHSDREMTWLALARFHPVNRLIATVVNIAALTALGFPAWAIALNAVLRNWYGHFLHADLPWTYGPVLGRVFVSPVLHRWHHVRDGTLSGNNFSTIFAAWDAIFGTWHCPHREVGPLGIEDAGFPASWAGQLAWPFRIWWRRRPRRAVPRLPARS